MSERLLGCLESMVSTYRIQAMDTPEGSHRAHILNNCLAILQLNLDSVREGSSTYDEIKKEFHYVARCLNAYSALMMNHHFFKQAELDGGFFPDLPLSPLAYIEHAYKHFEGKDLFPKTETS